MEVKCGDKYVLNFVKEIYPGIYSANVSCNGKYNKNLVAVKRISLSTTHEYYFKLEATMCEIASKFEFGPTFYFWDIVDRYGYIVTDLFDRNMHNDVINKKQEQTILELIGKMHKCNIFHQDLFPKNILIKGDCIRIADYGSSVMLELTEEMKSFDISTCFHGYTFKGQFHHGFNDKLHQQPDYFTVAHQLFNTDINLDMFLWNTSRNDRYFNRLTSLSWTDIVWIED